METDNAVEVNPAYAHPSVEILHESFNVMKFSRITYSYITEGQTVKYGVAFCAPSDQFCRRLGREIARGRLMTRPHVIENVDTEDGSAVNEIIRSHILAHLPHSWNSMTYVSR